MFTQTFKMQVLLKEFVDKTALALISLDSGAAHSVVSKPQSM